MDEDKLEKAVPHFRLAIENKPNYRFAHFGLGQVLLNQRKYSEAIEHFSKTLSVEDDKTPLFMLNLALAHAKSGSREQAIQYAQQASQRAQALGQTERLAEIEALLKELAVAKN